MKSCRCVEACAATCSFITRQLAVNKKVSSFFFFFPNLCSTHPKTQKSDTVENQFNHCKSCCCCTVYTIHSSRAYFIHFNFDCCSALLLLHRYISLLNLSCRLLASDCDWNVHNAGRLSPLHPHPSARFVLFGCRAVMVPFILSTQYKSLFTTHLPALVIQKLWLL